MSANTFTDVFDDNVQEKDLKSFKSSTRYKRNGKWIKCCFILVSIIVIPSVITTMLYNAFNGKNASEIPYTEGFIIVNENSVWAYNINMVESIRLRTFRNSNNILCDFHDKNSLFVYEDKTSNITNISNNQTVITCSREWHLQAFAVDYVTQKIYIVDKFLEILIVRDMQSEYYGVALSDLIKPHDIVLDVAEGLLFISQKDHSILRSDMDGTKVQTIINDYTYRLSAIAIDYVNKRIFWVNDHENIVVADYKGKNIALLHDISEKAISMTYINNQLWFLLQSVTADSNTSLYSCKIDGTKCRNYKYHPISLTNPTIIKSFSQFHMDIENPCKNNGGNCAHMCLLTSNSRHSCACKIGWQLHELSMTDCIQASSSMIYIQNNEFIRLKVIDDLQHGAFVDVAFPVRIEAKTLKKKEILNFDYDFDSKAIYFSDDKEISKKFIGKENNQVSVYKVSDEEFITDLALDWISKNLYFEVLNNNDFGYIGIINVRSSSTDKFMKMKKPKIEPYYSIIIQPNKGYLYYIGYKFESIKRMHLNGTISLQTRSIPYIDFPNYNTFNSKLIAFDYNKKKSMIYWVRARSSVNAEICFADLQYSVSTCSIVININSLTSIYVYKQYLYGSNLTDIYRFNKNNFSDTTKIIPRFGNNLKAKISSVKIFSPAIQTKDNENSCDKNNGGCGTRFCFSGPKITCV